MFNEYDPIHKSNTIQSDYSGRQALTPHRPSSYFAS